MVVTRLYGGLGNQMFQYAAGLAVARRLETALYVDALWFDPRVHPPDAPPIRRYSLDVFGITPSLPLGVRARLRLPRVTVVHERGFGYTPDLERIRGNVVLDGYWQSYRYLEPISDELRHLYRFPAPASATTGLLLREIAENGAVAIHVRRGDYVTNPKLARRHGTMSPAYYRAAGDELLRRRHGPLRYFVFSDDIPWCREHLTLDNAANITFVDGTAADHEDMLLMSCCRDHVIANSSFSWWGAWLGAAKDKIVIAPGRWFDEEPSGTADLLPPDWLRL